MNETFYLAPLAHYFLGRKTPYMYRDVWYKSADNLALYARDYAVNEKQLASRFAVICIHGLTRNSDDFSLLCERFSGEYRMVSVDVRGRGKSEYDPDPSNYHPFKYAEDIKKLVEYLNLDSVALIGTSMGGIISMLLAGNAMLNVKALVLNDIGPEVDASGLKRIAKYVIDSNRNISWDEAVNQTRKYNESQYPKFTESDWEELARQKYSEADDGTLVLNYDENIAKPLEETMNKEPASDMWPIFAMLKDLPLLVIRGELSDILSADCLEGMHQKHNDMRSVSVSEVGHPPTLNERVSVKAIDSFLQKYVDCA